MSKIMEVIAKSPDFKKNTCTLKLLDTGFEQLTKKIGDDPQGNFLTATTGDILSKQILTTLNQKQLTFLPRLQQWKTDLNNYFASYRDKGIGVSDFVYNFSSLRDYSSKYVPNFTNSDYYLLTEFVNAEKEMYEFLDYWGRNHIYNQSFILQEWSKTQNYILNISQINVSVRSHDTQYDAGVIYNDYGLTVNFPQNQRDFNFIVTGLEKIPLGATATIRFIGYTPYGFGPSYGKITITNQIISKNYGKLVYSVTKDGGSSTPSFSDGGYTRKNIPSSQFVIDKSQATLSTAREWEII